MIVNPMWMSILKPEISRKRYEKRKKETTENQKDSKYRSIS